MSNLIGSSKTTENAAMRARTSAAIRETAPTKAPAGGSAARLAEQALIDPSSLVPHFLARIAVNANVAEAACSDCGFSGAPDSDVLYIVNASWDEVAEIVYPNDVPAL